VLFLAWFFAERSNALAALCATSLQNPINGSQDVVSQIIISVIEHKLGEGQLEEVVEGGRRTGSEACVASGGGHISTLNKRQYYSKLQSSACSDAPWSYSSIFTRLYDQDRLDAPCWTFPRQVALQLYSTV